MGKVEHLLRLQEVGRLLVFLKSYKEINPRGLRLLTVMMML